MKCPECQRELEELEIDQLRLPSCPGCQGLWLDEETLRLGKDRAEPNAVWLDFELWGDPERFRARHSPRPCPQCEQPMVQLEYGETEVTVDHCDRCHAVWLDGGEFDGIVKALRGELASMTSTDYLRASIDEAAELITGWRGEEVIGAMCSGVFRASHCEQSCFLRQSITHGQSHRDEEVTITRLPWTSAVPITIPSQGASVNLPSIRVPVVFTQEPSSLNVPGSILKRRWE